MSSTSFDSDRPQGVHELYPFFNAPAATSTGYLARAAVNSILQGDMLRLCEDSRTLLHNETCNIM